MNPAAPPTRISVCIASYNGAEFIREQIDSILAQLGEDDEVVIVDDRSRDSTTDVVSSVGDPRIRLIRLADNVGYVRAFERALSEARNDLIFLSDQDDHWLPGRVGAMRAEASAYAVLAGNLSTLDGPGSIRGPYGQAAWRLRASDSERRWRNTLAIWIGNRPYYGSAMAVRRDALALILPFPAWLNESHDLWIALCGIHARSMKHLDQTVTARRFHASNQTPQRPRSIGLVIRSRLLVLRLTRLAIVRTRKAPVSR